MALFWPLFGGSGVEEFGPLESWAFCEGWDIMVEETTIDEDPQA